MKKCLRNKIKKAYSQNMDKGVSIWWDNDTYVVDMCDVYKKLTEALFD